MNPSPWQKRAELAGPALAIAAYWLALAALGGLTQDTLQVGVLILILWYAGFAKPFFRQLLAFLMPLLLTGIVYDSMRFYKDLIRGTIHVDEPYRFDQRFFGIRVGDVVQTPNEWWQQHTHWALDLVTGFFYIAFIGIFVLMAGYYRVFEKRLGRVQGGMAMMWSFFWLNVVGYTTYYWYAAAPPWYVSEYGLGPANLAARPNPAGCLRFDAIVGHPVFQSFYGKSNDVFGSIPSLHFAYPVVAVWFAHRLKSLRGVAWLYLVGVGFSAVYLNHHYILDLIWGAAYAVLACAVVERVMARA